MNKKYFWIKLKKDFFRSKEMKLLRKIAGGDTYTIIYLKMLLASADSGGVLRYESICESIAEEIALDIDEEIENVEVTLNFLKAKGLLEINEFGDCFLPEVLDITGSETSKASLMREKRAAIKKIEELAEKEEIHIPYIEKYVNNKRYGGNYYSVFNRDNGQCAVCGSKESLCVHHIISYDENDKTTVNMGNMVTMCRTCHSQEHNNPHSKLSDELLEKIGFNFQKYDLINETIKDNHGRKRLNSGNAVIEEVTQLPSVTNSYTEIDKEIDKDKDKEIDGWIDKDKKVIQPPIQPAEIIKWWNGNRVRNKISESVIRYCNKELSSLLEIYTSEDVKRAIYKIGESKYLMHSITFDWFLKSENFKKVLLGGYDEFNYREVQGE